MKTELRHHPTRLLDYRETEDGVLRLLFIKHNPAVEQNPTDNVHRHASLTELRYCTEGKMVVSVSGRTITVGRDEMLLIPPGIEHGNPTDSERHFGWVLFVDRSALPPSALLRLPGDHLLRLCPEDGEIGRLFHRIERDLPRFPEEARHDIAQGFVTKLFYLLTDGDGLSDDGDYPEPLRSALQLIRDHPTEIRGIPDLCERLFISRTYLHALFSKHIGQTPMGFIHSYRLLAAHEMIMDGEKATVAASKCGFSDYSSFFRNYKKRFGQSPAESKYASPSEDLPQ